MTLTILGSPATKKNSQRIALNKRTGGRFILQAAKHDSWAESAVLQLRSQWRRPALLGPVNLAAIVYRKARTGDLLNYLAAISDALEAAKVVGNDRQIVSLNGSRLEHDSKRPRVELELTEAA